ncbi:MAG TPA: EamA family transporter [Rhodospirillaceae bacterium]|nr:EamA family transporter [Rhodospirillaceae bacterium]HCS71080.1 EamA family transporter [Rhodospirillaceae bacterium]
MSPALTLPARPGHFAVILLLYAVTVIAWGFSWYGVQLQLGVVAPEVSVFYRFALSAAVMYAFCRATGRAIDFRPRDHAWVATQGLFLFGSNFYLVYLGAQYLPSGLVSILFSLVIVMNVAGGALFLHNRVEPRMVIGAVFGIGGIVVIFWPELAHFDLTQGGAKGMILVLCGTASAATGMLISALNQRRGLGVVRTNTMGMVYGSLFMLVYCLARGAEFRMEWTLPYIGSLLFLSIISTVVAFATYLTLVGRIGPERASYSSVLFPLVALAVSTWMEGFQWTTGAIFGVGCVLVGNLFVLTPPAMAARLMRRAVPSTAPASD